MPMVYALRCCSTVAKKGLPTIIKLGHILSGQAYFPAICSFRPHVVSGHSPKAATQFRVAILSTTMIIFATTYT